MKNIKSACIYVPTIAQYRITFYEKLTAALKKHQVDLYLVVDQNNSATRFNGDFSAAQLNVETIRRFKLKILGFTFVLGMGLGRILRSDVIIIQGSSGTLDNWLIIILSKILRKRILIWTLFWDKPYRNYLQKKIKWPIANLFHRLADGLICYNFKTQNYYSKTAPKVKSVIAHNGIELDDYKIISKTHSSTPNNGKLKCLYIGGLSENKNVANLLEAFKHDELKYMMLSVAGTGELRSEVIEISDRYRNISYLGEIHGRRKQEVIESTDLCIMPGEGGLFLLEANYFRKPVLFFKADGCEEDYLINNINCIKLDDQSVYSIISALTAYARNQFTNEIDNTWPLKVANTDIMAKVFVNTIIEGFEGSKTR